MCGAFKRGLWQHSRYQEEECIETLLPDNLKIKGEPHSFPFFSLVWRVFVVFGVIGGSFYLGHLASSVFKDS